MTQPTTERSNTPGELALDFAAIVEESLNEIFIFDAHTLTFIVVNKGARQNIGYNIDELRDMTPVDIKPEHTEESFRQVIAPLINREKPKIEFETLHQRKDGSTYLAEVHLQKMRFDDHPVLVAIILDITERTQIKSELIQARAILESAPDAMVVVNDKGSIQLANKQMTELLGYTHAELATMSVDEFVPLQFRHGHAAHRASFGNNPRVRGMGSDLNLSAVTKDGREIPIEVSLSPIKTSEGTLVAAAIRDISARKAVEDALQKSQQNLTKAKEIAESATATKSRFLAAASHDLRQPLQALRLYLSALGSKLNDPKALQLSEKMHLSLDTMGELLETLLDISTLESGTVKAEKRDVLLPEILDRIVTASALQAEEKGLKFECHADNCVVNTDPALLERIIENFVTNAIRYTEQGQISISCQRHENLITVTVSDSGAGIPETALENVFDEYYQLDNSVRDRSKGLGLGLSIVKHIARILDHPLNATSVVGQGSSFSVEVPLGDQDVAGNARSENHIDTLELHSHAPVVLIVDDDAVIIDAMAEVMDTFDIDVETAGHGNAAIALIKQGLKPDLLISDYRMPEMTGVDVVRKARELLQTEMPAVIMTGDTSVSKIEEANLTKCQILHKPIDMEQLIALIESLKN